MAAAEFDSLVASGLLQDVENIVVGAYLGSHPGATRPDAYGWLRYEAPDPVGRLADGVRRLRDGRASLDAEAVDKACAKARKLGFLSS